MEAFSPLIHFGDGGGVKCFLCMDEYLVWLGAGAVESVVES